MDPLELSTILSYIYRFTVTFVFVLIGALLREIVGNVNNRHKIKFKHVIASTALSGFLMCALWEYISTTFAVYVFGCVILGSCSMQLTKLVFSNKFATSFIPNLLRNIASPITKTIADTLEEDDDKKTKNNNDADKAKDSNKKKKTKDAEKE